MSNEYQTLWHAVQNQWQDIIITMAVAMISGSAAYLHKLRSQSPRLFSLIEFVADNLMSGVGGFIALMICLELQLSPWATGGIVGIVGHSAPRFLFLADRWLIYRAKINLGIEDDDEKITKK